MFLHRRREVLLQWNRRGAVGLVIASFAFFVLLVLPLLKTAMNYNLQILRVEACRSILEASLPAAYKAVSTEQLSLGRLILDQSLARNLISQQINRNMAESRLNADLKSLSIEFTTSKRPEPAGHWLSGNRQADMPVISAVAVWLFNDSQECRVRERIELVLD